MDFFKRNNKKKEEEDGTGIGTPYNVTTVSHVTADLNWEVANPDDIFELKEQLGRGAYGAVYKAAFKSTGFTIAAKQIFDDSKTQSTITKEVKILKQCNSPWIVNYYGTVQGFFPTASSPSSSPSSTSSPAKKTSPGVSPSATTASPAKKTGLLSTLNLTSSRGSADSVVPAKERDKERGKKHGSAPDFTQDRSSAPLWILMDFCSGGSVRDYMDVTALTLTEDEVGAVLAGALQGLFYLHSQNIIHRDLKSGNILLSNDGSVKIADFGISTQLSATVTGNAKTMIGTTYWMAPEVLEERYTSKIDIWSLGITAIEMVENDPPNWHMKPFQLILKLPTSEPPTFKNPKNFSPKFVDFVTNCLQKDPFKRPDAKRLLQHAFIGEQLQKGPQHLTDTIINMCTRKQNAPPKQ